MSDSAFVSADTVWPRDASEKGGYRRWSDRGGYAIQIDQDRKVQDKQLGPITIEGNTFADSAEIHEQRSPIHHEADPARPQKLRVSDNYELNWGNYQGGTRGNNYSGVGIDRFNEGSTALDGAFGSRFSTIEEIVEAAVNRDRGEYGTNGVPEARDLASFYRERAIEAAA